MSVQLDTGGVKRRSILQVISYGVRIEIRFDKHCSQLVSRKDEFLPGDWKQIDGSYPFDEILDVVYNDESSEYGVILGGSRGLARSRHLDEIVEGLRRSVQDVIAFASSEYTFVEASVAAIEDRAILFPGPALSGKSTLLEALRNHGATVVSDSYAVFDRDGFVHTFPPELGAVSVKRYSPTAIAWLVYEPRAKWAVENLTWGKAALQLLGNAVPARDRPEEVLKLMRLVTERVTAVRGKRGEASDSVPELRRLLELTG